uniref:Uncharacterized protein n=1 Tax=Panagrolaimus sp. ES5 TaxID=591445 RepID=A0AC34G7D9_9BILA
MSFEDFESNFIQNDFTCCNCGGVTEHLNSQARLIQHWSSCLYPLEKPNIKEVDLTASTESFEIIEEPKFDVSKLKNGMQAQAKIGGKWREVTVAAKNHKRDPKRNLIF